MGKYFSVTAKGKTYKIRLPKFMQSGKKDAPVSVGHAIKSKEDRKSQFEAVEKELNSVGKSEMEKQIFDNDYTDN